MGEKRARPDAIVSRIATRQHGVVSIRQLHSAGLGRNAVSGRLRKGQLHRVHRGIYTVGHQAPSAEGTWMAAVLACGAGMALRSGRTVLSQWGAALSHHSAAALWQLLPLRDGVVDVSVPGEAGRRRREGIRVHRRASLSPASVTLCNGIPVTTPGRTVSDLRRLVSPRELRRAIRQAEVLGLSLGSDVAPDRTRSELEHLFLRLCRRHRLPMPEVNVRVGSLEVDFLWRERRLVVETDGYRYHRGRAAFEDDRARDLQLRALGYEVVRLSFRQVADEPERVAAALKSTLRP